MKEDALKILHDPTLRESSGHQVGLPTAAVESGGMLGYVEELHKGSFDCGVPNAPCVVSVPSFAFGHEVPLCAFELGIKVEMEPFKVGFPEAVSRGLLAFLWQVVFKVINKLLGHALWHFVVLGSSIHFGAEFHSDCGMNIKVVMLKIESVDEREEEGIGDDHISSVVGEGVWGSAGALIVDSPPGRGHGSKISPPVIRIK
jgi:hypothetical protein